MRLLSNLKYFIKRNKPVIMRQQTFDAYVIRTINNALDMVDKNRSGAINPVIRDLDRVQNRITHIQEWLKHNFQFRGSNDNDY